MVESVELRPGLALFEARYTGPGNFVVWLQGAADELLVNEIGSYEGTTAVGVEGGSYLLDVQASDVWSVNIREPRHQPPTGATQFAAVGDGVTDFLWFDEGLYRVGATHDGSSNFVIWLLDDAGDRQDMLTNEIGEYDRARSIRIDVAGVYLFAVEADGGWTLAVLDPSGAAVTPAPTATPAITFLPPPTAAPTPTATFKPTPTPVPTTMPTPAFASGAEFTVGSSKQQVLAAQGNPQRTDDAVSQKYFYGLSWVQFDWPSLGGAVIGWDNAGSNLKLAPQPQTGTFSVGSSKQQVLAAQGNPPRTDAAASQKYFYGLSWVQFDLPYLGGAVIGWDNVDGNLKVTGG